jgi:hypothetical protein
LEAWNLDFISRQKLVKDIKGLIIIIIKIVFAGEIESFNPKSFKLENKKAFY